MPRCVTSTHEADWPSSRIWSLDGEPIVLAKGCNKATKESLNVSVSCLVISSTLSFSSHPPCCLLPSVLHFSAHSSCHSPPLSSHLPFSALILRHQRCHVREWVFWGSRGVSLQLVWKVLVETYTSKLALPGTLKSYTSTVESMGGEVCFHCVFIRLMERRQKKGIYWSSMWPPGGRQGVKQKLCRGSASAVLSF